ncbi:MFS transporter, partial [Rhizobium ruizarguesonis]
PPVLTDSLVCIVLGIWQGRYGGRLVYPLTILAAALAPFLLSSAQNYTPLLIAGLGVSPACDSFAVDVSYVSTFFPT